MARTLTRPRAYLCISIDCECDKGVGWRTQRPLSFVGVHEGIGARLAPLLRRFRARATYLLSPELLQDAACVARLRALQSEAELGTHLHGEMTAPGAHVPEVTEVVQRAYPEAIERAKLRSLGDAFAAAFGRAPRVFRAGRFGLGERSLDLLAELGYTVDSSVTPFVDWSAIGGLSFVGAPTQPYRPDPAAPARPGSAPLCEVPVTIRPSVLPLVGWRWPRWLRPTRGSVRGLVRLMRDEIADGAAGDGARPVVLNAMFHNVEVVPGASPYARSERQAGAILRRLEGMLEFAASAGIPVVGLEEAAALVGGG
jgi:hypothetical protein